MKEIRRVSSMLLVLTLIFGFFGKNASAASVTDGKDSKGTYTIVTYTAADLKKKIKKKNKSIAYYKSNTSAYIELLADATIGVYSGGTALFLGASQISAKKHIIKNLKADKANYKKLLTIANKSKHGVKVKRYYLKHYATSLGMVKNYYNGQKVYSY